MGHHSPRTDSLRTDAEFKHLVEQTATRLPRRDELGIHELLEENEKLRALVVELSRIVARNALEKK
jgi:hypothetical protein